MVCHQSFKLLHQKTDEVNSSLQNTNTRILTLANVAQWTVKSQT